MRPRLFRASVLGIALAFVQIGAATGDGACLCGTPDRGPMEGMQTMATHQHAPAHAPAPADVPTGTHHRTPCSHPMSQHECANATTCATPAMAVASVPPLQAIALSVTKSVMIAAAPGAVSRAPEPPPPRA